MISALILASAFATQTGYSDGPPRTWEQAVVNGKTVWIWGWKNPGGGIAYHRHENAPVFNPPPVAAPKPDPVPLGAGMVLEANGTINSGVNLQATHATVGLETNDTAFGAKLGLGDRVPDVPNDQPTSEPAAKDIPPWLMLSLVGGVVLILILIIKD